MLIAGYLGSMPRAYVEKVWKFFLGLEESFSHLQIYSFYQDNSRIFYALAAGEEGLENCRDQIYKRLIRGYMGKREHPLWTYELFEQEQQAQESIRKLKELLACGITAPGFPGWYTRAWEAGRKWEEYSAPSSLVKRLKTAVCQEHLEETDRILCDFLKYFQDHAYRKEAIRQAMMRNYFMILDLLQEMDKRKYQRLQNQNLERMLGEAMTWEELGEAYGGIREVLRQENAKRQDISNYIILKVIQYIREHYKEKIVLEQVAEQMGVTPEYLSTLFNREMKENFSVFLKKFRISHAKRLLAGTQMKIYEVAQEVGYSDAKYFTRVFKEEEGISPGDYRQMQQ